MGNQKAAPTDLVRRLDPQALIQQAISSNAGIETLERLFALAKDVRAEQAREAWNVAISEFQRTCPKIIKDESAKIATKSGGGYTYNYAALDGIMNVILPKMGPLGLSVSWRNRIEAGKVIANCRVSHDLGHFEESGEVAMPVDEASSFGASPPQRVGIAMTYAKRYSLLSIIGLAPEDDPDAQATGGEGGKTVSMPQRRSQQAPTPEPERQHGGNLWTGQVLTVGQRVGKKADGTPWTLYTVKTKDGQEFITFSDSHADFAREAGSSSVLIEWEPGQKGGQKILHIEAHEERESGE